MPLPHGRPNNFAKRSPRSLPDHRHRRDVGRRTRHLPGHGRHATHRRPHQHLRRRHVRGQTRWWKPGLPLPGF